MSTQRTQPSYNFSNPYRGQAIVIVNKNFKKDGKVDPYLRRLGSGLDKKNMKNLFEALDFKVKVYKDLTADQMKKKIEEASAKPQNEKSDCFVVVISTHGEEVKEAKGIRHHAVRATVWKQELLGSDYQKVGTEEIINMVDGAPTLKGKPKLFFIQACRSREPMRFTERFDLGQDISVAIDRPLTGTQPSDAGDHSDGVDMIDSININETDKIYQDWSDPDTDEWDGDMASDEEDIRLGGSDIDFTDAELEEATGKITAGGKTLTTPSDDVRDVETTDARPTTPDRTDAGHSQDTGRLPAEPFDITGITDLPNDCLLVYPIMFGRVAFRKEQIGSRMLHLMGKADNRKLLLEGANILRYLTQVAHDLASSDIKIRINKATEETIDVKANICVQHRLLGNISFTPKTQNSIMAQLKKKFFK